MVIAHLTNGFGNNIFQFVAAKQLALYHNQELIGICGKDYYARKDLEILGISLVEKTPSIEAVNVNDNNYLQCFSNDLRDKNFIINGYFENYKFYIDNLTQIKKWFPPVEKRENNDLVVHFRAGDRLLYRSTFEHRTSPQSYFDAVQKFEFDKLHIVTDMPKWEHLTAGELRNLNFHVSVAEANRVDIHQSVDYYNSFIDIFDAYNPIVEHRTIIEDFNFIRSFDNILFEHGTLGWWAAVLSNANKVGVYGPWRAWKGTSNKNLSQINLKGWFQWG